MGTTAAVTVGTTATLVIPANVRRTSFYLLNNGAESMFVGETASATTVAAGFPLAASSQVSEDEGNNVYKGDVFAIVAVGTEEARFWERGQSV